MDKHKTARSLLAHALPHVAFDGWTEKALSQGAKAAGMTPAEIIRVFPRIPTDMLACFAETTDEQMLFRYAALPMPPEKIRARIATLIRLRLEVLAPHREAVRRAMALYALPVYMPQGMKLLAHTADAIWRAAGDTSTDFNWYTKRTLLAGVYSSTVLYWLNDESEGNAGTWEFLDRRIDNIMQIQKVKMMLGLGKRA